jgi:hypothetical protein
MNQAVERHLFDRRLFTTAAIALPLIVLAGFGRTYYLKGLFDVPPLPSRLVHLHGLLMTAWVALFVTQVWLISSKRVRLHRRLGYSGIGLGMLIVAVGFVTALRSAKYGSASTPPEIPPLVFLAVPLFDLLLFAVFFGGAIYFRRHAAEHKRLMLLTAIGLLPPAVARIPIASLQALGPLWFFGVPTVAASLCVGLDWRRHGRVNTVFLVGTIVLILSFIVRLMVMGTAAWLQLAGWLTTLV